MGRGRSLFVVVALAVMNGACGLLLGHVRAEPTVSVRDQHALHALKALAVAPLKPEPPASWQQALTTSQAFVDEMRLLHLDAVPLWLRKDELAEAHVSVVELCDDTAALSIAQLIGADAVLVGNVRGPSNSHKGISVVLRLLSTADGHEIAALSHERNMGDTYRFGRPDLESKCDEAAYGPDDACDSASAAEDVRVWLEAHR